MDQQLEPIPQPKTYGALGNLPLIDKDLPTLSFAKLADEFGPIYRFEVANRSFIAVSGHKLVAEVCDESRFDKSIGHLLKVRDFAGDGLFTSLTKEPNWAKAHHILIPSFSQPAMKGYHARMVDIALQARAKMGPAEPRRQHQCAGGHDPAYAGYDRFMRIRLPVQQLLPGNAKSVYRQHGERARRSDALFEPAADSEQIDGEEKTPIRTRHSIDVFPGRPHHRRTQGERGAGGTDLLARMLSAADPETGELLDDENIRFQIITFLIAGHETTSGLLSFTIYFLLKNPDVLKKPMKRWIRY